jgi:predicted phosphodiesterase
MTSLVKLFVSFVSVSTVVGAVMLGRVNRVPDATQPPAVPAAPQPDAVADPASGFKVAPYLQYPTRTGIKVMCETFEPTTCSIAYGTALPGTATIADDTPGTMHELRLDKLIPKTRYFYQVTCTTADGKVFPGKWLSFFTAPDTDDAWSFTVIGDTQRNPIVTGQIAKLMWERRPNFVMHCGDVVDAGPDNKQWTGDLFTPCLELFGRVAVLPCIGNHEKNHAHYYQYFSLPKPEYYYSFRYGNAEFFSIDTNKKVGPGTEQFQWLDRALAKSDATWKICFHHHPPYSSDNNDFGDSFKTFPTGEGDRNARSLVELYEKHKVDVVFNGHVHIYERTWPIRAGKVDQKNGVLYITSGGGGGKLEDFSPTPAFFKAEHRSDYHFCYVTVHRETLRLKAIDRENRLFDQIEIKK